MTDFFGLMTKGEEGGGGGKNPVLAPIVTQQNTLFWTQSTKILD